MKKILIITGGYLPGYKYGGPILSIKNLTDNLGNEYEFYILTSDRDYGSTEPYQNIKVNDWNLVGKAKVYYVEPNGFTLKIIKELANNADIVYSCGVWTRRSLKVFLLKKFGFIKKPVVVASMGMFSPKEFHLKYWKKKPYTILLNITGMFQSIYWSATSELEVSDIKQQVKARDDQFFIAEDLPRIVDPTPIHKIKNDILEIVWISRITPKKNLKGAIRILKEIKSNTRFSIYGPIFDETYWQDCLAELERLPSNIKWSYYGDVRSDQVVETLKMYHILLFPTLGENYGHVIQEALSAGCACILSDQTPWRNLEDNGVGYAFPVEEISAFVNAVEKYARMSEEEINDVADKALKYAVEKSNKKATDTGYRTIFDSL